MQDNKKPEYKFEDSSGDVLSITRVAKLEPYLVEYKDGQAQTQTRLVFNLPGTDYAWIVQKQIHGSHVITEANEWFRKEMAKKIAAPAGKVESV
jgi:hypothetical protein